MTTVVLMSGVSGVGKSTMARNIVAEDGGVVISADDYFMREGRYEFSAAKLPLAHAQCLRRYIELIQCAPASCTYIVVDNTNTTVVELAPYVAIATAYGFPVELRTLRSELSFEKLAARSVHGCSLGVIRRMQSNLEKREIPTWWDVLVVTRDVK